MGIIRSFGKSAAIGIASVLLYEGVNYLAKPTLEYEVRMINKRPYVLDLSASPVDTVAAPKLFEVYGFFKDVSKKSARIDSKYSEEQGWYESRHP